MDAKKAFEQLKELVTTPSVLELLDFNKKKIQWSVIHFVLDLGQC